MKIFDFIDTSENESRHLCYIFEFFQFPIHEGRDGRCLFQLSYEYDPYGWTDPLFATGFSVLEYPSLFRMYFKIKWSLINFSIFANSMIRFNDD